MRESNVTKLLLRYNWLDAVELKARVIKVLALHHDVPDDDRPGWLCDACGMPFPCPTRRALDGEEE